MAGPWEKYGSQPQAAPMQAGPWNKYASQPQVTQESDPSIHRGAILPIDRDADGNLLFNSDSGLLGVAKRAFTLPGDVYSGRVPAMVPDTGQGVTNPEMESRAKELAAITMPVSPAAGTGRAIAASRGAPMPRRVPTREELYAAGNAGYNRANAMGVDFNPEAIASFASVARAKLDQQGFNEVTAPNTYQWLQRLENPKGPYLPLSGLDSVRRGFRKGQLDSDRQAGAIVISAIDRLTENPPASAVLAGPAAAAGAVQKEARGNWAAMERSKELSGRQTSAERRARASNSGKNIDNTLRQRVASLLDQIEKGKMRGYSAEEIAAMNEFVDGKITRNSTRFISNLLGGGGGAGSVLTGMAGFGAGGYALGPKGAAVGVALPALGWGMKTGQNALGRRAMKKVDEQVRSRSPLYEQMQANPQMGPQSPEAHAAMLRAMMLYGPNAFGPPQSGGGGY